MLEPKPILTQDIFSKYISLIKDDRLIGVLNHIDDEYFYWDKVKYQECPEDVTKEELWGITKIKRLSAYSSIEFGKYKFRWNTNSKIHSYLHFLDMNIGGTLESSSIISREDKSRYLISSLMEEAIASSQIEGAVTTRPKAKEMLRKNKKPTDKSEQMILNNYITIQRILELKNEPLNRENLLALHKLITSNTMSNKSEEGALRIDNEVDVVDTSTGEIVHHPPNMDEIDVLLNDLIKFFNDDKETVFIHPLVKASIIHFMIGYIHPFTDGNGRTARALFYWYLIKKEYWLVEYLSISRLILRTKGQYARAFQYTEIDDLDLTYFILFKLKTMKLSFEELRSYIQRKNDEKMKLSNFVKIPGVNYKQAVILEWFDKDPSLLLTIKETENRLAISRVSARKNLLHLSDMGFITTIELDKKSNGFIKSSEFDVIIKRRNSKQKNISNNDIGNIPPRQTSLF